MKFGTVTPERSRKPSLTINVRTRSPIEAFQMLRQGHPIDTMAAYYDEKGLVDQDFWMLDKTAKLHKLAELRTLEATLQSSITEQEEQIQFNIEKQKQDAEEKQQASKGTDTEKNGES